MSLRRAIRKFLARRIGEARRHLAAFLLAAALIVLAISLVGLPLAGLATGAPSMPG
ncbi:hypothetical protein GCM10027160_06900 [Streptomyces calidiresistens]|uniref:Uncharacterized protein n=1 Tax=Streptomyces calidiresistens TaxID=1485586 RepID=A0A7W3T0C1_9ACTN|nr:hypothetical protein [Streptomyces calidiresistens]MBB0228570.1 hypothetical protein [Streptomyces calidiresistens]